MKPAQFDSRLINQVSSLIMRSVQIKLSGVISTDSGVHKGLGFCMMLLTDINETTDSSDRLWALFHFAHLKRAEDVGEDEITLAGTAGLQTRM